jgi:hypothetical protein
MVAALLVCQGCQVLREGRQREMLYCSKNRHDDVVVRTVCIWSLQHVKRHGLELPTARGRMEHIWSVNLCVKSRSKISNGGRKRTPLPP